MAKFIRTFENGTIESKLVFRGQEFALTMVPCKDGGLISKEKCLEVQIRNAFAGDDVVDEIEALVELLDFQDDEQIQDTLEQLEELELIESDGREFITKEQAIALLPDGENIHTFRQAGPTLIGADWERSEIINAMDKYQFELTGPAASSMGHGMAFEDECGLVFVATKEQV